ncbi:PHD finger protein 23-like [Solenopsis invicta]|uniref:PHD finger protein 23-like n=1 Tax=Solenopsis invicta TaxID=13686 RepID=UPI00193DE334|nr:PHD finger protein 23-like [Solenopsis invicta]
MGLLPAPRGAERPKAPPTAGKIARQSGAAPQKGAGNAAAVAARPAPTPKEATPSILELWTEVVSKKTRKKAVKAAERATKTAPPPVARPTRVLPIPPPKPPPTTFFEEEEEKKEEVRGVENGTKADALAEGIREALGVRDDVKVARPCKTVELRLSGLDNSVIWIPTPPPAPVPMVVVEEEAPLPQRERSIRTVNAETRETEMEVEEPQGTTENVP